MEYRNILKIVKEPIKSCKWGFLFLTVVLLGGTFFSLLLPEILSNYIDNLQIKSNGWLIGCALLYCATVLFGCVLHILNTYISEMVGWKIGDALRVNLFEHIFKFDIYRHKESQSGDFLERVEGDINLLLGFFSSMSVDILSSLLLVVGVLAVFYYQYSMLGFLFTVLSFIIIIMFIKSQKGIASLWKDAREKETEILEEFSQDIVARVEIAGAGKQEYVQERLSGKFDFYEKSYTKASFVSNIPSTVFYSLLNVGEGIVLVIGVILLGKGEMTLGDVYLILSYVGLLNIPFFNLKYEFSQLPRVLAALRRIGELYRMNGEEKKDGKYSTGNDKSVVFEHVTFSYTNDSKVLKNVSFEVGTGEHVIIEGRTGSGKSTILQLMTGLYSQQSGQIIVGGRKITDYKEKEFHRFIYYILQNNPIMEDTIRNNITRYEGHFSTDEIEAALEIVHMEEWLKAKKNGLETVIKPSDVSQDEAQLLAWAGAILRRPGLLLADEFDATIHDETVKVIDEIVNGILDETTIILVSHQKRTRMKIHKRILVADGEIAGVIQEKRK